MIDTEINHLDARVCVVQGLVDQINQVADVAGQATQAHTTTWVGVVGMRVVARRLKPASRQPKARAQHMAHDPGWCGDCCKKKKLKAMFVHSACAAALHSPEVPGNTADPWPKATPPLVCQIWPRRDPTTKKGGAQTPKAGSPRWRHLDA